MRACWCGFPLVPNNRQAHACLRSAASSVRLDYSAFKPFKMTPHEDIAERRELNTKGRRDAHGGSSTSPALTCFGTESARSRVSIPRRRHPAPVVGLVSATNRKNGQECVTDLRGKDRNPALQSSRSRGHGVMNNMQKESQQRAPVTRRRSPAPPSVRGQCPTVESPAGHPPGPSCRECRSRYLRHIVHSRIKVGSESRQ